MTLLDDFYEFVKQDGERPMFHRLDSSGDVDMVLSRRNLWNRARSLAIYMEKDLNMKRGDFAMMAFPFGVDFVVALIACMRLGVVAVSVYPPNPNKLGTDIPKFRCFLEDCNAGIVLTNSKFKNVVRASRLVHSWPKVKWVAIGSHMGKDICSGNDSWVSLDAQDIAFVQYTSGSTGNPKGICVSHGNLNHQLLFGRRLYEHYTGLTGEDIVNVAWTPQYHDMGLIANYVLPMHLGSKTYVMNPLTFLQNPILWAECLSRYGAHATNGPSFSFALVVKRLKAKNTKMKNPTVKLAISGGEPSDIKILPDVQEWMGIDSSAMQNAWGCAESVVAVSIGSKRCLEPNNWSVGNLELSRRWADAVVCIVKEGKVVPDGVEGEVWVSSGSVTVGYLGKHEVNKVVFNATLEEYPNRRFLRTGDAGLIQEDHLHILSRIKDLIIINGRNISPVDLERAAEKQFVQYIRPGCSVAFQKDEESVVLVLEVQPNAPSMISLDTLSQNVRRVVETQEGVCIGQVVLTKRGTLPKTTSGKVRRKTVEQLWRDNKIATLSQATRQNIHKATSLRELLETCGISDWDKSITENGVDSLQLTSLIQAARDQFQVEITFTDAASVPCSELLQAKSHARRHQVDLPMVDQSVLPSRVLFRLLGQLAIILAVLLVLVVPVVPAIAFVVNVSNYSEWWVVNGRAGPLYVVGVLIWMMAYTILVILCKHVVLGKVNANTNTLLWSPLFVRWLLIQRLFAIWEYAVGIFVMDTPIVNIVYKCLGADVAMSARIQAPFREWDLVSIGPKATVNGFLYPRMFQHKCLHFGQIVIGRAARIETESVLYPWVSIGTNTVVQTRTFVGAHSELPNDSEWVGVPCEETAPTSHEPGPSWVTRLLTVATFGVLSFVFTYFAGLVIPAPATTARAQVWTSDSAYYVLSYLAVYQLVGVFFLILTIILKWLFVSTYLVDRFAATTARLFFPYIFKDTLSIVWLRLFGAKLPFTSHMAVTPFSVDASKAHLVQVGSAVMASQPFFAPKVPEGIAENVWSWLKGGLKSPWSYKPDIVIPDGFEIALKTRVESGAIIDPGAHGAGVHSCLRSGSRVESGKNVFGIGSALMSLDAKTEWSGERRTPPTQFLLAQILTVMHLAYLTAMVFTTIETLRTLPVYDWKPELSGMVVLCLAILMIPTGVALELVLFKYIAFFKSTETQRPMNSTFMTCFLHSQNIQVLLYQSYYILYGGLLPVNALHKLLGCKVDLTTTFINEKVWLDANDSDLYTLDEWSVFDVDCSVNGHIASSGVLTRGKVHIHSDAVVHPFSGFFFGSVGHQSHLMPWSANMKPVHINQGTG
mmetsp:Transcript_2990/g.5625  ORF Transcript_2990/g.5625 Transcript_2990/m.5625 type:complete len:1329 (-) Transcript_2990:1920-5906(-)